MRKPRDYDSELKALEDRARQLKDRRIHQLGELVIATGADALTSEQLAGALLAAMNTTDGATREAWTRAGAVFFQRGAATRRRGNRSDSTDAAAGTDRAQPPAAEAGAAGHAGLGCEAPRAHASADRTGRAGYQGGAGRTCR